MLRRSIRGMAAAGLLALGGISPGAGALVGGAALTALPAPVTAEGTAGGAAEAEAQRAALIAALQLDEIVAIMREEGLAYGADIGETLLGPRDGPGWERQVSTIYDPARMLRLMTERLERDLAGEDGLDEMLAFFDSEDGQRLVELEVSARRAMLEPEIDDAARAAWAEMAEAGGPRVEALRRFVAAGDLIEANVVGGMNSTFAFYTGLREAEGPRAGPSEAEMLADVWAQEPGIRAEIEEWLFAYLALAYGPVPDAELQRYIDFFEAPAGQRLNTALFQAFHGMFATISHDLGLAAGRVLAAEDL